MSTLTTLDNYLHEHNLGDSNICSWIRTDHQGVIHSWNSLSGSIAELEFDKGKHITEALSALEGMFPLIDDIDILPNIQCS